MVLGKCAVLPNASVERYAVIVVEIQDRVNQLVAAKAGLSIRDLQAKCLLLHGPGIRGDDAAELLTELAAEFDTDMTGFPLSQFFPGAPHLLKFWKWPGGNDRYLPLTLEDLYPSRGREKIRLQSPESDLNGPVGVIFESAVFRPQVTNQENKSYCM